LLRDKIECSNILSIKDGSEYLSLLSLNFQQVAKAKLKIRLLKLKGRNFD